MKKLTKKTQTYHLWTEAKRKAKAAGVEFALTIDDIKVPSTCPLIGSKLIFDKTSDFRPSIERIDNNKGFTKDNILVASHVANKAKDNLSLDMLKKLTDNLEQIIIQRSICESGR